MYAAYGRLFLITVTGIILDQLSKWVVFKYLSDSHVMELTSFLSLVVSRNPGGVFGIIRGANYIFILFSIAALVLLFWVYQHSHKQRLSTDISFGCIFAGALGNLIDRLVFNYVRDFIDLHLGTRHWPTFNIADALICVGVGIIAWKSLFPSQQETQKEPQITGQNL